MSRHLVPVLASLLCGCSAAVTSDAAPATPGTRAPMTTPATSTEGSDGAALVDQLTVTAEHPRDGYDRGLFNHWIDADADSCDTRAEVLIEESRTPAQVDPFGCAVLVGDWVSQYDAYATPDPTELEVDHVVALAEAWDSGAVRWDPARREAFANDLDDPGALIAVTAAMNQSKGDRDPAQWQPPNRAAWCDFALSWARVKVRWGLSADDAEIAALRNMLVGCE